MIVPDGIGSGKLRDIRFFARQLSVAMLPEIMGTLERFQETFRDIDAPKC